MNVVHLLEMVVLTFVVVVGYAFGDNHIHSGLIVTVFGYSNFKDMLFEKKISMFEKRLSELENKSKGS